MGLLWLTIFLVALSFGGKVEAGQKRKMLLVEVDSQEAEKGEPKAEKGADYRGFQPPKLLDCWKKKGVVPKFMGFIKPGIVYY